MPSRLWKSELLMPIAGSEGTGAAPKTRVLQQSHVIVWPKHVACTGIATLNFANVCTAGENKIELLIQSS